MSSKEEAMCSSLTGEAGPCGEHGGDMTVVPRVSLAGSSNLKGSIWAGS